MAVMESGQRKKVDAVRHIVMKGDWALGGEHTMKYTYNVL